MVLGSGRLRWLVASASVELIAGQLVKTFAAVERYRYLPDIAYCSPEYFRLTWPLHAVPPNAFVPLPLEVLVEFAARWL